MTRFRVLYSHRTRNHSVFVIYTFHLLFLLHVLDVPMYRIVLLGHGNGGGQYTCIYDFDVECTSVSLSTEQKPGNWLGQDFI